MLMSRQQNVGQKRNITVANRSFENVARFSIWKQQLQTKIRFTRKYDNMLLTNHTEKSSSIALCKANIVKDQQAMAETGRAGLPVTFDS
jgi:hypothetical protein